MEIYGPLTTLEPGETFAIEERQVLFDLSGWRRVSRKCAGMWMTHRRADGRPRVCGDRPPRKVQHRFHPVVLLVLLAASLAMPGTVGASVDAVGAVDLTVSDLDRSVEFYTGVLTFEIVGEAEVSGSEVDRLQGIFGVRMRVARLRLGDEDIELTEYVTPRGRPAPVEARSNDRWFQHIAIIVRDMDRAYARLREHGVEHVSPEPQRLPDWNPNAGGIEAFYFKDPDGYPLEILAFPEGKGDAKWHRAGGELFLGIDHTAIVVNDTETSLRFYRDVLGLSVTGENLNYGIEQERLNLVFGARLRITGLRAAEGPGIEFLEYLSPRDGRPMPADERPNDLIHWQTVLLTRDLETVTDHPSRPSLVSSGPVVLPDTSLGFRKGALIRESDGHVLLIAEP